MHRHGPLPPRRGRGVVFLLAVRQAFEPEMSVDRPGLRDKRHVASTMHIVWITTNMRIQMRECITLVVDNQLAQQIQPTELS